MSSPVVRYVPFGAESWRDPYPLYTRLRDEDPVHYEPGRDLWVLSRFAEVHGAALDSAAYSSARGISLVDEHELLDLLPTMVMMDPPTHTRYRRLVNRGFSARQVQPFEPVLRAFVRRCVERLCEAGTGDFVDMVARPVPCFVVAHFLGVPAEDRDQFERWTSSIVAGGAMGSLPDAGAALGELYRYFGELVEHRRRHPGDDMVSALTAGDAVSAGITAQDILGYAFVMVAGGNDTATGLLAGAAQLLTEHRDERRFLLDRLGETGDLHQCGTAVDELLRFTTPVQGLCRVTTRPVGFEEHGAEIPAGARVMLCYGSANRDEREFGPDASRLDLRRDASRMLTFASGPHYCMGAPLARMQGRVVLEELLRACPNFAADGARGTFAPGAFVRRFETLPVLAETAS
ncbi:MAG: cytochrome P450 [Acidimicrobiales bacterium]